MADVHRRRTHIMTQSISGAIDRRLGILQLVGDIGHMVFDRLEGADGDTKLLPLPGILYRQVDHALGQPQTLGGHAEGAVIEGRCHQ